MIGKTRHSRAGPDSVPEKGSDAAPLPFDYSPCACAAVVRSTNWPRNDGMLRIDLRELAQQRIAKLEQPKTYVLVEGLPWNPSGKILKRLLGKNYPGWRRSRAVPWYRPRAGR